MGRMAVVARLAYLAGDPVTPLAVESAALCALGLLGGGPGERARVQAAIGWLEYVQGAHLTASRLAAPRVCA